MYPAGTLLRFVASETGGDYEFDSWRDLGTIVDDSNPKSVVVRVERTIVATADFKLVARSYKVTLRMNFEGATSNDAKIFMAGQTHNRTEGPITQVFKSGTMVEVSCDLHDAYGQATPFLVNKWDVIGAVPSNRSIAADGSSAKVTVTVLEEDVVITVNIIPVNATLQTKSRTKGEVDQESVRSTGGTIDDGAIYAMGSTVMVWATMETSPNYYLDIDPNHISDGWALSYEGVSLGGKLSAFKEFEQDPLKPGTFTGVNAQGYDPDSKHTSYRQYAQDVNGNYIVPGPRRDLVIKYTDPEDTEAPRQYGKLVELNFLTNYLEVNLTPDPNANQPVEFRMETDSTNKLDTGRDKSGGLFIHESPDTPAP
jgi:hypothetical protein